MPFPSASASVPSLLGDQLQFLGLTMGSPPNTPFGWTKIDGISKSKLRSGNTPRPRQRGAFPGLNLLDARTITLTMDIGPPFGSYVNLAGAMAALRSACSTEGTTESPLWIQVPNFPLLACMARVVAFDPPYDISADLGSLIQGVPLQFEATDPYFYSAPTSTTTISLPTPGVGFSFPITFPLSFGGASGGNQQTVTNLGNVPCWPLLTFTGPCLNPSVSNSSIAGSPTLMFNVQLYAGDMLVVDCDQQSIVLFPSGQSGSPVPQVINPGSTFFALNPGVSNLIFNSQDLAPASGTLTVAAASAYDGIL